MTGYAIYIRASIIESNKGRGSIKYFINVCPCPKKRLVLYNNLSYYSPVYRNLHWPLGAKDAALVSI